MPFGRAEPIEPASFGSPMRSFNTSITLGCQQRWKIAALGWCSSGSLIPAAMARHGLEIEVHSNGADFARRPARSKSTIVAPTSLIICDHADCRICSAGSRVLARSRGAREYHFPVVALYLKLYYCQRRLLCDYGGSAAQAFGDQSASHLSTSREVTLTDDIDEASAEIQSSLAREMTWFLPAEAKHMDPASVVEAIATLLASSYLAGFQQEAKKALRGGGKRSFQWLKARVTSKLQAFEGPNGKSQPHADEPAVQILAQQAVASAAALDEAAFDRLLNLTEEAMRRELVASSQMPEKRAAKLAAKVRKAVETKVLRKVRGPK